MGAPQRFDPFDVSSSPFTGDDDYDNDGLSNLDEIDLGTDPLKWDSDGDGLMDGWEVESGLNPLSQDSDGNGLTDASDDADGDGLSNELEYVYGTDVYATDSDGDGVDDGTEVANGSLPHDAGDQGMQLDPTEYVRLHVHLTGREHAGGAIRAVRSLTVGSYSYTSLHGDDSQIGYCWTRPLGTGWPPPLGKVPMSIVPFDTPIPVSTSYLGEVGAGCRTWCNGTIYPHSYSFSLTVFDPWPHFVETSGDIDLEYYAPSGCHYRVHQDWGAGKTLYATVRKHDIEFTEIKNLYNDDGDYELPYTSLDDLGRVYVNRRFNPGDPSNPTWEAYSGEVDFTVEITSPTELLPPNAYVEWTLSDPDDPADSGMHDLSAQRLDPNDFDGGVRIGDIGGDNEIPIDAVSSWWEELGDGEYSMTQDGVVAQTAITAGRSRIRFLPDQTTGSNYRVKATVKVPGQADPRSTTVQTGTFTVWRRIELEVANMPGAVPITQSHVDALSDALDPACTEVRAQFRTLTSDTNPLGGTFMAAQDTLETLASATGEFTHANQGGWFFALGAIDMYVGAGAPVSTIYSGNATITSVAASGEATLTLPPGASLTQLDIDELGMAIGPVGGDATSKTVITNLDFNADELAGGTISVRNELTKRWSPTDFPIVGNTAGPQSEITFMHPTGIAYPSAIRVKQEVVSLLGFVNPGNPQERILHNVVPRSFDESSGTLRIRPKRYREPDFFTGESLNYTIQDTDSNSLAPGTQHQIIIATKGAVRTYGVVWKIGGGRLASFYPAGFDTTTMAGTINHEFAHAIGFDHICGNWDVFSDEESGGACCMHYAFNHWMLDNPGKPLSFPRLQREWVFGDESHHYCVEHIVAIRKANLAKSLILGWD